MSGVQPSGWAAKRFGDAATDLAYAVPRAVLAAHGHAMRAQLGSALPSNDAYGATLAQQQHVQLLEMTGGIAGVQHRKLTGLHLRHPMILMPATSVVLYPCRTARDPRADRYGARLRVSGLRRTLLHDLAGEPDSDQLSLLDDGTGDLEELEAARGEERQLLDELATLGRVVTIGYGSNPSAGVFSLVWGDAILAASGHLDWSYQEPLPFRGLDGGALPRTPLVPLDDGPSAARFDDGVSDDDLDLRLRPGIDEAPTSEPEIPLDETGSDEDE